MEELIEQELKDLENRFWKAMVESDVETMIDLTDETCILTGAQGVSKFEREDFRKMVDQSNYKITGFDLSDWKISVLNDETAVVGYKVSEKLTVDGKPVALTAADASTWVRKDGKWVCSLHTESISGDPFGRDKIEKH